jgi:hypothetical protein
VGHGRNRTDDRLIHRDRPAGPYSLLKICFAYRPKRCYSCLSLSHAHSGTTHEPSHPQVPHCQQDRGTR